MPKKTKKGNRNISLALTIAIIIVLSVGIPFALEYKKMKSAERQKYYENWLPDNCNCLERNRTVCGNQSFAVQGNYCINEKMKLYTSVIKTCSRYDCSGDVYDFDLNSSLWRVEK